MATILTIKVSTRTGLEDMRSLVIIASNKQANTIGSLAIPLGADLHLVTEISNHPGNEITDDDNAICASNLEIGRGVSWAYLLLRHSVLIHLEIVLASAVRPAMETPT